MIDSEATDGDSATDDRPIVEVVLDEPGTARAGRPIPQATSAAAMLAAMGRLGLRGDPPPAPPEAAQPPASDAPPPEPAAPAAADSTAPPADPPAAPASEARADDAPPAAPAPSPADHVDLVAARAEAAAARQEAALLRARLAGAPDDRSEARRDWLADPIAVLRQQVAAVIGKPVDSKDVDEELAYLQRELTSAAIGVDNLSEETRHQRSLEQTNRRWRVEQHTQAASRGTAEQQARRADMLRTVSQAIDATAAEHPYLALAHDFDGLDPATAVDLLWAEALQSGRAKRGDSFEAELREALRLSNEHYRARHERTLSRLPRTDRAPTTAPAPAPAPAQASAPAAAPGAPKQPTSPAPAQTGSASPGTLRAHQAAAAPSVKAPDTRTTGPIIVDPSDRDGDRRRIAAIAAKYRRP